jgi:hypothetical protein
MKLKIYLYRLLDHDFLACCHLVIIALTWTSRNQKGEAAQGIACQRQEKGDKCEAFPTATFPRAYCSRMWLDCSTC